MKIDMEIKKEILRELDLEGYEQELTNYYNEDWEYISVSKFCKLVVEFILSDVYTIMDKEFVRQLQRYWR